MEGHPGDDTPDNSLFSSEVLDILSQSDILPSDLIFPSVPSEDVSLHGPAPVCRVCETPLGDDGIGFDACEHRFCKECVRGFLVTKIGERDVEREFHCLAFQCGAVIPDEVVEEVLSAEEKVRLVKFKRDKLLEADPFFRWCPRPDCTGYDTMVNLCERLTCNVCGFTFCAYCHEEWHQDRDCPQGKDKMLDKWLRENKGKFCPQCKMRVEKNEGCMHMTCITCGYEWCWRCGESYHNHETCIAVVKRHWADYPLTACLFILFLPVIVPFAFVILVFMSCGVEMAFRHTRKLCTKLVIGSLLILLGIAVTPFGYAFVLMATGHVVLFDPFQRSLRRSHCCTKCWVTVLYLVSGLMINPFVLLGAVCFVAISPVIGCAMVVLKVVCMRNQPELRSKVPGYPVS